MSRQESDIAQRLIKEHEDLNRNIAELKLTITENVSAKDYPDWRVQFLGRLRDLRTKLSKHFEFEEQGGFMKEVTEVAPRFLRKVNDLEIEHKRILVELQTVTDDFKKLDVRDDLELQDIFNRLSGLIHTLHEHENTENSLMQRAFCREHGSPD